MFKTRKCEVGIKKPKFKISFLYNYARKNIYIHLSSDEVTCLYVI